MADAVDAALGERLPSDRTDAPHEADGQRVEERPLVGRLDHDQPVRFGHLRRDLGEVLGARRADRDRQPDLVAHPGSDPPPDDIGLAEQAHGPGDVEEGFVDRDPLDEWREVVEHRHDLVAQPLVLREVAADEREVGAQLLGPPTRHPSLHSEFLGLVRRRQHHAASDGDRPAAQVGLQHLLDRRVERVEVGVKDGGRGRHLSDSNRTRVRIKD